MGNRIYLFIAIMLVLAVLAFLPYTINAQSAAFYVSPSGSDSNPGTLEQPFRTIEKARDTVRTINSNMNSDITVFIRDGVYNPIAPVVFGFQDSGTNGYNIIYRGYPGERAEISGGQRITGWTSAGNGIYKASVASFPSSALPFRQLFVNGQRAIRARTPNAGSYYRVVSWDIPNKRAKINRADIPNSGDLTNVEAIFQKQWRSDIYKVTSYTLIDATYAYLYFFPAVRFAEDPSWMFWPAQSFHYENSYDFLDSAGEWFYNPSTKEVFYKPRAGEDMNTAEVIAPVLVNLVKVEGSIDSFVHNIQFVNLIFEHATWLWPNTNGYIDHQSGHYFAGGVMDVMPGAINVQYANNITFKRNLIRHTGHAGLVFHIGTHDNLIIGNVLSDIGGNGIAIDNIREGSPSDNRKITKNESILNNYITKVGQDFYDSVGIFAGYVQGLEIEHNEISDSPYSGISEGWGWDVGNNIIRDVSIRYNRIYNVMNLLCDGAAIYTLGDQSTTNQYETGAWLEQNYIYDIIKSPWTIVATGIPVAGIYPDLGSAYLTMQNNVFENVNLNKYDSNVATPKMLQWIPWPDSNVINASIKAAAGIEAAYADIRDGDPLGDDIPPPTQTPYSGTPISLPGTVQAENYDAGGEGIAYHDTTSGNSGGQYRSDGVDIWGPLDGSYVIGDTQAGEWLEYTVNVASSGTYTIEARVSSIDSYGKFHIEIDGVDVTGQLTMPAYGGSLAWSTMSKTGISLAAGQHIMRISLDNNGNGNLEVANLNWVRFAAEGPADTQAPSTPTNLIATTVSSSQINLAWTASTDNVGVTGYRIYRNGTQIATSATNSYSSTGLSPSTTYVYSVSAYDAIGNVGGQSASASATTQPTGTGGTGPVAWWKFDETSGEAASDSSGNGNTGTLINSPLWSTGKIGGALSFDGTDDYVSIGDHSSLDISGNITLSAWVKYDTGASGNRIISKSHTSCAEPYCMYSLSYAGQGVANRFTFELGIDGIDRTLDTATAVSSGQWYHVAATYDGSSMRIYLNGVQDNVTSRTGSIGANNQPVFIGKHGLGAACGQGLWDGTIDDVRIYNRALSSSQIKVIYSGTRSDSSCDGCVSNTELSDFINLWYLDSSDVTLKELIEAIGLWKAGGCS